MQMLYNNAIKSTELTISASIVWYTPTQKLQVTSANKFHTA